MGIYYWIYWIIIQQFVWQTELTAEPSLSLVLTETGRLISVSIDGSKKKMYTHMWYGLPPESKKGHQELCPFVHDGWYKVQKLTFALEDISACYRLLRPQKLHSSDKLLNFHDLCLLQCGSLVLLKASKILATSCSPNPISIMAV